MKRKIYLISITTFLQVFLATQIIAEKNYVEPDSLKSSSYRKLYHLEGIRVFSNMEKTIFGTVYSNSYEMGKSNNYDSIAESMKDIAGISISTSGKGESDLKIRGFDKRQVAIFIDGRPFSGGYFGNVDLETLSFSDVKEIQIVKGPTPAVFGNNVMGGIVNIVTKKPGNDNFFETGISLKDDSSYRIHFSSSREFNIFNYWLFMSHIKKENYRLSKNFEPTPIQSPGRRLNSHSDSINFNSRFGWNLYDVHNVTITAGYSKFGEKAIPPDIYDVLNFRRYTDWQRFQKSITSSWQLGYNFYLDSSVFYDFFQNTYVQYTDKTFSQVSLESIIKNSNIAWDLSSKYYHANNITYDFGYRGDYQFINRKDNAGYLDWTSKEFLLQSGFLQLDKSFIEDYNIVSSLNFLYFIKSEYRKSEFYLEPAIGLSYNKGLFRFFTGYSRNFNFPTMRQLYSASSGNPDLRPERADKFEITLRRNFIKVYVPTSFRFSVFYNNVYNQINRVFFPETFERKFVNVEQVDLYGMDLSIMTKLSEFFTQSIDYSFVDNSKSNNIPLFNYPRNSIRLKTEFKLNGKLSCYLSSNWRSRRRVKNYYDSEFHLPSYFVHYFAINKDFRRISMGLKINNILDQYYEEDYGLPASGRSFELSVIFRY